MAMVIKSTNDASYPLPSQAIDRASLPPLPDGWEGPPSELLTDRGYWYCKGMGFNRAKFLAALLNACYPVGGK